MARDTAAKRQSSGTVADRLPNLVTIVGRGVPSSFELTVAGEIEPLADDSVAETSVVSDGAAEGTIDVGVRRFRFSGELANVQLVDWNGIPAPESSSTPTVHVEYDAPNR